MRESKILDALPDDKFKKLEEIVERTMTYKGPAWVTSVTDKDLEEWAKSVIKGYKQGRRQYLLTWLPLSLLGAAAIFVWVEIFREIKKSKKKRC